ncbi:MAG: hypothetical protein VX944_04385 [Myxococcota bacterium]|nr:hypothetical protein [Myxococcota bacterium]
MDSRGSGGVAGLRCIAGVGSRGRVGSGAATRPISGRSERAERASILGGFGAALGVGGVASVGKSGSGMVCGPEADGSENEMPLSFRRSIIPGGYDTDSTAPHWHWSSVPGTGYGWLSRWGRLQ